MAGLTADEVSKLGAMLRDAKDGNLLVGLFAAAMVGESYPFSMRTAAVVFQEHSDEALGRRFARWCDARDHCSSTISSSRVAQPDQYGNDLLFALSPLMRSRTWNS